MQRFRRFGRICELVSNWSIKENDDGNYRYLPEPTDEFCRQDFDIICPPRKWMTKSMFNYSCFKIETAREVLK